MRVNRLIALVVCGILLFVDIVIGSAKVSALTEDKARFLILDPSGLHLENAEGKYIDFKDPYLNDNEYVGDMNIYKLEDYSDGYAEDTGQTELIIPKSNTFSFTRTDETIMDLFFVEKFVDSKHTMYVNSRQPSKITFSDNELSVSTEGGTTCDYSFGGYMPSVKRRLCVTGMTMDTATLKDGKEGIGLTGANGKVCFDLTDKKNKKVILTKYYYIYNNNVTVKVIGDKLRVSPAVAISNRKTSKIQNLYLRPVNGDKNMFLSWDKVKKAKSYVVYKYDSSTKKYTEVAVRNGISSNFYNIPSIAAGNIYKYKVAGMTKRNGKGKVIVKTSYPVWATAKPATLGNATKVTTNKTKLVGKVGKTKKLKATVEADSTTKLSTYIRWYSSNKKVAKVNRKTGVVKLKRKGKCYIWAKAHNGKNSKKVVVKVR